MLSSAPYLILTLFFTATTPWQTESARRTPWDQSGDGGPRQKSREGFFRNLSFGGTPTPDSNHEEGEKVAAKVKQFAPEVKIIAYTTLKDEPIAWADVIAIKGSKTTETSLIEAFKKLGVNLEKGETIDRS